ncbi:MAG: hypothetical protein ACLQPH_09600 [Acidimicrobiales bacterium]
MFIGWTIFGVLYNTIQPGQIIGSGREAGTAALAAALWVIVLSVTSDLRDSWRGPVRAVLWSADSVFLWVLVRPTDASNLGTIEAIKTGLWLSAVLDLIGLTIIVPLLYVRDARSAPDSGASNRLVLRS